MVRTARIVLSVAAIAIALSGQFSLQASAAGTSDKDGSLDHCEASSGGAALLVQVKNIRSTEGNLRAQVYSSDPDEFLAKGKKLVRVDVPVTQEGEQNICVPVPSPGTYAFVVMHDRNANGKADFFTEGFGFTNNPKLNFGPPDVEDTLINVLHGVGKTMVTLKYLLDDDNEKSKKRRKLNRR